MAFAVWISRCSGAMSSDMRTHSSTFLHSTAKLCFSAATAVDRLGSGSAATCAVTSASTASSLASSSDRRMARATTSCSACAMRSAAITDATPAWSQITSTSDGPASMSMPHRPLTMDLAAVTHLFPGPTITSHCGTDPGTPCAIAATACAPPRRRKTSHPDACAAARVMGAGRGEHSTTVSTPAARAVTTVMTTLEGRG
mmetsp:Transcript_42016/g.82398  ORF Transcript_42016/g.82398 Transcript_42016/m.82398 type:complete len:200 (+) Transcript_42016:95-694(+)